MPGLFFANPMMLWGLLLAVIPIALHLLLRRRARVENWGAMQFLNRVLMREHRRLQVQSWLHLLVRVAILACLALALADPRREEELLLVSDSRPTHRALILDASMSMQAQREGVSRFEKAQGIVRTLLARSRQGDSWQLFVHRGSQEHAVVPRPTFDAEAVRKEVDALAATFLTGDLESTLRDVREQMQRIPEGVPTELIFLTDLQAADWSGRDPDALRRINRLFRSIAHGVQLSVVDVGSEQPNVAVTGLSLPAGFVWSGHQVSVPVTIENAGDEPVDVPVELLIDSIPYGGRTVRVPARSSVTPLFDLTIATPGRHVIEARIPEDALAADNRRWGAVNAIDVVRVLAVRGERSGSEGRRGADYLRLALDPPRRSEQEPARRFQLSTVHENRLRETDLSEFDVVFLCNLAFVNRGEAKQIAEFVGGGGGLVIVLGEEVQPESYHLNLGPGGENLLPARILSPAGGLEESVEPQFFVPADEDHPIVSTFADHPEAGLQSSRVYRYFRTEPYGEEVQTVLSLSGGDPLLMTKTFGRGSVLLLATALDRAWGSWVVWPSFVPLMHEAAADAARGRARTLDSLVGDPVELPTEAPSMHWTATDLDGRSLGGPTGGGGGGSLSPESSPWGTPGVSTVRTGGGGGGQPWTVVRNVDPRESDLARATVAELRSGVLKGITFESVGDAAFGLKTQWTHSERSAREPSQLARWLILGTLALVLIDLVLARSFRLGATLLGVLAGLAAVRALLPW